MEQICMYTEITQTAQKIEYLGKFETNIETILGRWPGPQMGSFDQTTLSHEI